MDYIATVFSHYAAINLKRRLSEHDISATLGPVPRSLSSSCGTCVYFSTNNSIDTEMYQDIDEIEQVVMNRNGAYIIVYANEDE